MASTCLGSYATVVNCNEKISDWTHSPAREIENGDSSAWHYLWIYPINFALSLIGIALAPIAALVDFVTAFIFKMKSYCCNDESDNLKSQVFFTYGLAQLTDLIGILFIRMFYPAFNCDKPVSTSARNCLFS